MSDQQVLTERVWATLDFEPDDLAVLVKRVDGVAYCRPEREWSKARELRLAGKLVGIATASCHQGELLLVRINGWHTPSPAVG